MSALHPLPPHTPGPYGYEPHGKGYRIFFDAERGGNGETLCVVKRPADARPFTAAPDLLEALAEIIAFRDRPGDKFRDEAEVIAVADAMWAKSRAAIAKATGQTAVQA